MAPSGEGEASAIAEIATTAEALTRSEIFHIVKEIVGFILYMHHQIPSILQNLEHEYDALKEEYKGLEEPMLRPTESKASISQQRMQNFRKREVKQGIKKLDKLMNAVTCFLSSFQEALDQATCIMGVILLLGGSPTRPQHAYELLFSHGNFDLGSAKDSSGKSSVADALSRRAIRALISNGAGSASYSCPTKLYLLVRCSSAFNSPLHFLPKRDFRYSKKVVPYRLHIKCKAPDQIMLDAHCPLEHANLILLQDSNQNDEIWFQCRHVIKGMASKVSQEEG